MKNSKTKYTPTSGVLELRKAICTKFKNDNDLIYEPNQIVVSTGAKQSLANAFLAILNKGDEVILPIPYWVSYPELIKLADGVPIFINNLKENDYKYKIEEALKGKAVRLARIAAMLPQKKASGIAATSYEGLQTIRPLDMALDVFKRKYGGTEMPDTMKQLLESVIKEAGI